MVHPKFWYENWSYSLNPSISFLFIWLFHSAIIILSLINRAYFMPESPRSESDIISLQHESSSWSKSKPMVARLTKCRSITADSRRQLRIMVAISESVAEPGQEGVWRAVWGPAGCIRRVQPAGLDQSTIRLKQFHRGIDVNFIFWEDQCRALKSGDRQFFSERMSPGLTSDFGLMLLIRIPTDSTAFSLSMRVSAGTSSL